MSAPPAPPGADAVGREPALAPPPPVRVPRPLEIATAWAWRLIIVGVAVYVVAFLVVGSVQLVTVPLLLAVLIAALLQPLMRGLVLMRLPRFVAAGLSVVVFITFLALAVTIVSQEIVTGVNEAGASAVQGLEELVASVEDALGISPDQFNSAVQSVVSTVGEQTEALVSGALTATGTATTVFIGMLLTLFALYFYLAQGDLIWRFIVSLLPAEGRRQADVAGRRSWTTLSSYVRALPVVAAADALGIGVGAAVLGVPFAIPIAIITFIGAFVPVLGAIVTGILAVLIALVTQGLVDALILLAIVFAVQQVESYLLQPLLLGRAVKLHPLAVVLATTTGLLLAGVVGGVLAVPLLAMFVTFVRSLSIDPDATHPGEDLPTPYVPDGAQLADVVVDPEPPVHEDASSAPGSTPDRSGLVAERDR